MIFLEKFETTVERLDEKKWYTVVGIFLGGVVFLTLLLVFYYFWQISDLKKQLQVVNESREEVRTLLTRAQYVQKQRQEVDAMLAAERDFKLAGYITNVLAKLGLRETMMQDTRVDREGKYQEVIVELTLDDLNMKQLTEFLSEVGKNRRVYTKKLDILKSKKTPSMLEVNITLATLLLK